MPEYRYFTTDVLTGGLLGELPLYGVNFGKKLKSAGNFTGTFRLGTGVEDDGELMGSTQPMRSAMYCQRDGVTIWGGIVWSRTFESNAKTIQLSAQTFESYLYKVLIKANLIYSNLDQLTILKNLVNLMQSTARSNIGIDTTQLGVSGINKNLAVKFFDAKYFGDAINDLADGDDGFDWSIQVSDGPTPDAPVKTLLAGYPNLRPNTLQDVQVFDYPGSIDQFYWPESGSKSGTDFLLLGRGSGSNMLTSYGTWDGSAIFPEVDQVISRKDISSQTQLDSIAQATANAYGPALSNPTVTLKSDSDPQFDGWNGLGSYYRLDLESPRFANEPNGIKSTVQRMLGWELSPADSESTESLKLILEGDEESV